jgi:hypothetical protein
LIEQKIKGAEKKKKKSNTAANSPSKGMKNEKFDLPNDNNLFVSIDEEFSREELEESSLKFN